MLTIIKVVLYLLAIATAFPVGYFLAGLCKDELRQDRLYFIITIHLFTVISVIFIIMGATQSILLTMGYMLIVLTMMVFRSRSKK